MAAISTLRGQVDITHLSGDTLTIKVTVPAGAADGLSWRAQIRIDTGDPVVMATFDILLPPFPGEPAFLTLRAADSARLAPAGEQFNGVWDCQLAPPDGSDPVTTVSGGKLILKPDVTR